MEHKIKTALDIRIEAKASLSLNKHNRAPDAITTKDNASTNQNFGHRANRRNDFFGLRILLSPWLTAIGRASRFGASP